MSALEKDHDDWLVLGDAMFNIRRVWNADHEKRSFSEWWCGEQQAYLTRWPRHEQHLKDLFSYLDDKALHDRHYKNVSPAPPKMQPCSELKG